MRQSYKNLFKDISRHTAGRLGVLVGGPPTRFVILSNHRSGSNLLVSVLKQHPRISVHSEIFGEYQLEDRAVRRTINRRGSVRHLETAFRPLAFEQAVGLKTLYYQMDRDYGEARGIPDVFHAREALFADDSVLFLHLKRADLLSVLVSSELALRSEAWVRKSYETDSIRIEPEVAEAKLGQYETAISSHETLLPGDRTLDLSYEDLSRDMPAEAEKVFSFLKVDNVPVSMSLKKQTTKPHQSYVANFEELRQHFSGSRYARYFG